MAEIFESRAKAAVSRGETELVPLLHRDGVELLVVSPQTRYTVVNVELGLTQARVRTALSSPDKISSAP